MKKNTFCNLLQFHLFTYELSASKCKRLFPQAIYNIEFKILDFNSFNCIFNGFERQQHLPK